MLYWFEVYNRDKLLQKAELELQSSNQTAEMLGLEKLEVSEKVPSTKFDVGIVSKLQERLDL